MRQVVVLSLVLAGAFASACGDNDDNSNNNGEQGDGDNSGGDGDRGNGGDGDNTGDGDSSGGDGDDNSSGMCEPTGGDMGFDDCSEAEIKAYASCVEDACEDKYVECYGPSYKQGKFAGPCGDYMACTSKCECDDTACTSACELSSACTNCMAGFASCSVSCLSDLECAGIGGSGKTCSDLLACCNSLSDADLKDDCTMTHGALSGVGAYGDIACGGVIGEYCP